MDSNARQQNGFLQSLSTDDFEELRPHLRTAELTRGKVLQSFGELLDKVYFPHDCVLSRLLQLDLGEAVALAMVGPESLLGAMAAAGMQGIKMGARVVLPGAASVLDIDRVGSIAERRPSLNKALARYGQSVLLQGQQAVSCKAQHPVEARLARWLLEVRDLSGSDQFTLTPEMMAQMIGARSNSIAIVAHTLEQQDYITLNRDVVEITDPDGLRKIACTCYSAIKAQHQSLQREGKHSFACREVRY